MVPFNKFIGFRKKGLEPFGISNCVIRKCMGGLQSATGDSSVIGMAIAAASYVVWKNVALNLLILLYRCKLQFDPVLYLGWIRLKRLHFARLCCVTVWKKLLPYANWRRNLRFR